MNKSAFKFLKRVFLYTLLCVSGCLATSCIEDIPEENRFTWTGELIATYLEKQPEKYSKFITILKKANISDKAESSLFQTLSTYGSYTCFAPTNEAIDRYLTEMSKDPERTKITSNDVELLESSVATEIAKNHIIGTKYKASETNGRFAKRTMNRRSLKLTIKDGEYFLDNSIKISEADIETENGTIQTIEEVISPSNKNVYEHICLHSEFKLFAKAIEVTGLDELLEIYEIDPEYKGGQKAPKHIKAEGEALSPDVRNQCYTVLLETDALLADPNNNHLGISIESIEDLETLAQEFYGNEAPGEYNNKNNALYKYISYHIIDRQLYYEGNAPGGFIMQGYTNKGFNSESNLPTIFDRQDYFETMLPYSLIKVTKPFTNEQYADKIVLNYAQENGTKCVDSKMSKYLNVTVLEREKSGVENFSQEAQNGLLHTIDKILVYNEDEMAGNVLNERMRWDVSSFFPEWTNNGVRWQDSKDYNTTYIPHGYSERLRVNGVLENTSIIYLRPHQTWIGSYPNYQGDEILAVGRYDFEYRIPHVPAGDYEIRFGYSTAQMRAITQIYFDGKVCGIPIDMALGSSDALIGWTEDKESINENKELDKAMRNRGYMKGPASCHLEDGKNMRESYLSLRLIVGKFKLEKGKDYWLRFKNVTETDEKETSYGKDWAQFNQDFLEIVPTSIINNPAKPEDQN